MGCKVVFSPQALADLEAAVRFIAQNNPAAAVRFGNALIDRAAVLENFPLLGSPYPKHPGVCKLVFPPHIIFIVFAKSRTVWTFCVSGIAHNASRNCLHKIKNRRESPFDYRRAGGWS